MNNQRKIFLLLLSIVLTISGMDIGLVKATAEEEIKYKSGIYTYTLTNGNATIVDVDEVSEDTIIFPDKLDGYTVTTIASLALRQNNGFNSIVKKIVLPETITEIERSAFFAFMELESINIPKKLVKIEPDTFEECRKLKSVEIPENVEEIGTYAFSKCYSLSKVVMHEGITKIDEYAFEKDKELVEINLPSSVKKIGYRCFADTKWLVNRQKENPFVVINGLLIDGTTCKGEVRIPDYVTTLCEAAFLKNDEITEVTIPDTVYEVQDCVFDSCINLKNVNIELDKLVCIPEGMFAYCEKLEKVNIPNSIKTIGLNAFMNCKSLKSISIPDSVESIRSEAFINSGLENVIMSKNIVEILYDAFEGTPWLEKKRADNPVVVINSLVIDGKKAQGKVVIPKGCKVIDYGAFYWNASITNCYLPESVSEIRGSAFVECINLKNVSLPKSIKRIGEGAFGDCKSLTDVYYAGTIKEWKTIKIDDWNENIQKAKIHCCDGIVCDKHTLNVKKAKKASFFENGYTGDHICSYCGRIIVKGKVIPKLKLQKLKVKLKYKKKQIIVTYKRVAQATRYEIEIKMKKKWEKYTTRKTKYKIKRLVSGKRYKIRVRAVIISKNKVAHSKYKMLKTKKIK